jgi:IS5 family transposase
MAKYKQSREEGWFDETFRGDDLEQINDFLPRLNRVIDWDIFLPELEAMLHREPRAPGGAPAYHPLLKLKMLVLGKLYCLSDEQLEFQCADRRSFSRFLGLSAADAVPDANTIRHFRDTLGPEGVLRLFERFNRHLGEIGVCAWEGHIVDATFVEVPRQRNGREENEQIKAGRVPEGWEDDPKRLAHKDRDARWARKGGERHYGYKNHVKVGVVTKFIKKYAVSDAAQHDSQAVAELVESGDESLYGDSAFAGQPIAQLLAGSGVENHICEKGVRGRKLSDKQKKDNREKSRTRARVEHVFGFMTMTMKSLYQRCIGKVRNATGIGLTNLVYNLCRLEQVLRLNLNGWNRWEKAA